MEGRRLVFQIFMLKQMKTNTESNQTFLQEQSPCLFPLLCVLSLINLILLLFIQFSYFIFLFRLQKMMNHFILLFSLLLAPAFADKESHKTNQNFSSNNASHKRLKRDWIWNQMHIKEEIDTPLPHHVGKVKSSLLGMNSQKCRQKNSILKSITCLQPRQNRREKKQNKTKQKWNLIHTNMLKS